MQIGRSRDKCRWRKSTRLTALMWVRTLKSIFLTSFVWGPIALFIHEDWERGLPVFVSKQDNRSSHRGGQKDRLQSGNLPTYCLVYSRRLRGHVLNVVDAWPRDLHHWGKFALWSLSFWPPLYNDLLCCLFTKTGRLRAKCRWRHLSRDLPIFVNKQDNRSSHRGGHKDRLQSANLPQCCKSCGQTSTSFITWPPSLRGDDLLSSLFTKTARPRAECCWCMTTRFTPLR
jgi:hypothetical protein